MKKLICCAVAFALLGSTTLAAGKIRLVVRIIKSQVTDGIATFTMPGYSSTNCQLSQSGSLTSASCSSNGFGGGSYSAPLTGAVLALALPTVEICDPPAQASMDSVCRPLTGLVVLVKCEKKVDWGWDSGGQLYRSCRVPVAPTLTAEFDGDNAKLFWSVSIDGSKTTNETYKIIAVLRKSV